MILDLTRFFKNPPPLAGQARLTFENWEKGFDSYPQINENRANEIGNQFAQGWRAARRMDEIIKSKSYTLS